MTQPVGPAGYTSPMHHELEEKIADGDISPQEVDRTVNDASARAQAQDNPWERSSALRIDERAARLFLQSYTRQGAASDSLEDTSAYITNVAQLAKIVGMLERRADDAQPGVIGNVANALANAAVSAAEEAQEALPSSSEIIQSTRRGLSNAAHSVSQGASKLAQAAREEASAQASAVGDEIVEQANVVGQSFIDVARGLEQDAIDVAEGIKQDAEEAADRVEFVIDTTVAAVDYAQAWWES